MELPVYKNCVKHNNRHDIIFNNIFENQKFKYSNNEHYLNYVYIQLV